MQPCMLAYIYYSYGMQRVVLFEARWPHSHGRIGPGSQAPV